MFNIESQQRYSFSNNEHNVHLAASVLNVRRCGFVIKARVLGSLRKESEGGLEAVILSIMTTSWRESKGVTWKIPESSHLASLSDRE